jgi:hypothetical protein
MNALQIHKLLTFDSHTKPVFKGVYPKNRLPRRLHLQPTDPPSAYVVNFDDSHLPGSHWVALFIDPKHGGEYFDSYGNPPIEECQRLLDLYPPGVYNLTCLQEKTLVCGQYCVLYLLLRSRGYSMHDIVERLNVPWNDGLVHQLVRSYFPHIPFRHK